jgi:NADPH-dependent glutamate synthase beta subunit-like oxidoreductase/CO/xanthine dehydrogenase FAD-binding subunit
MRDFEYKSPESFNEASKLLKEAKTTAISGGTDLVTVLRDELLVEGPDTVVNLKTISGAEYITAEEDSFKIGALTKLVDLAESPELQKRLPILSEAAGSVATPLIRNSASIGGNICQDVRCEYYRYPHQSGGRNVCYRKGGKECLALHGNNEYHSVFGGIKLHNSPCTDSCPAGTDIPGYLAKLRNDDLDGAAQIILKVNPLAALTGRVCAHFCQEACNRNDHDQTGAIGAAERYVGDYILENSANFYVAPKKSSGKKVAIVGSGPAGLSAAYFLRKEGHYVVIYDRKEEAGGVLQYAIPAFRLPKEYVKKTVAALKNMGIEFKTNTEIGKDVLPEKLEQDFDKVFYDTGAWGKSVIGFDGEELTVFGLEFLTEVKDWIGGKLGQNVLVVGGGNVAMDVATTAKRLGAANVTAVCIEKEEEMPAGLEDIRRSQEQGVEILNSYGVSKVVRDGKKIKGLELVRCVSVFDENGRFAPVYDQKSKIVFECDAILMATGQKVDLSFLDKKYQLELTARGLVAVDENFRTSKKNVFAGGDMISGPATVVKAIAAGHGAADAINNDLCVEKHELCDLSLEPAFLKFDEAGIKVQDPAELPLKLPEDRTIDTEDHYAGLTWEQVKTEASRCQNCGCLAVNPSDIGTVLVALDAIVKTTEREIRAVDFFTKTPVIDKVLNVGEIVKEIEVPVCDDYKVAYQKLPLKDGTNFAVASLASAYKVENGKIVDARIVLGGVAPVPYRVRAVEAFVKGKGIDEAVATQAGKLAYDNAVLLKGNSFKLKVIDSMINESLLNAAQ